MPPPEEIPNALAEVLSLAATDIGESQKNLTNAIETYAEDIDPRWMNVAEDYVKQAKTLIKELVVAKGLAIKEDKERTAIQRRQGTLELQP